MHTHARSRTHTYSTRPSTLVKQQRAEENLMPLKHPKTKITNVCMYVCVCTSHRSHWCWSCGWLRGWCWRTRPLRPLQWTVSLDWHSPHQPAKNDNYRQYNINTQSQSTLCCFTYAYSFHGCIYLLCVLYVQFQYHTCAILLHSIFCLHCIYYMYSLDFLVFVLYLFAAARRKIFS